MKVETSLHQIAPDTWQIREEALGASVYQYLVAGSRRAALIDTGMYNSDLAALARTVTDKPIFAVNTHGHLDHISANHQFWQAFLHPKDEGLFLQHSNYEVRQAYLGAVALEKGLDPDAMDAGFLGRVLSLPARDNRAALAGGQELDLGGRSLEVIETPGHTQGSVCLLDRKHRLLFTGDTVCDLGVLLNLPGSAPVEVFLRSMETLQALAKAFDRIWPGHHACPLQPDILARYKACAALALSGDRGSPVQSAAGQARLLAHAGISLALPADA